MKNFIEYVFLRSLQTILCFFSFRVVQKIGRAFGMFVYYCIPVRKKLVQKNLQHAYPEKRMREINTIAYKNFQNIFMTFFETFWLKRMTRNDIHKIVSIPESYKIEEALKKGNGLIILSGHITNWELSAIAAGVISGHAIQIIVKKQHNPYVDTMMNFLRTKFNNSVVDMDKAPREIIKRLRENGVVAMLADQSGPEEGLFINFFGRPASTHVGPAVFSLRTGAAILMANMVRHPEGTYKIVLEEINTENLTGSDDEKILAITTMHVQMLEKYVRKYPDQWLWMHKRWKHTEKYLQRMKQKTNDERT